MAIGRQAQAERVVESVIAVSCKVRIKWRGQCSGSQLLGQAVRAYMKSLGGRFRFLRDPSVAYAVLIGPPRSEAPFDTTRINDLERQIAAMQRQLKAMQRRNVRVDTAGSQSDICA